MEAPNFAILVFVLIVIWFWLNPGKEFGFCIFGFTIYDRIPVPYFDLTVHANGGLSLREGKSHNISLDEANALLNEGPEILIIGTGYNEFVKVDERISRLGNVEVIPTPRAIRRFNELKKENKKIAAIIHTTC